MPKCTVCHHPQLQAIEQALLSEEYTLAALSQKFGPSSSALQRHKGHLRDKMRESRRRLQEIQEQGSLFLLNAFLEHVKKGVETAEAEGNLTGVFRGSYIGSRIIYQLNRMEGSISLDTLHRLLTSPAWVPRGASCPPTLNSLPSCTRPWSRICLFSVLSHPLKSLKMTATKMRTGMNQRTMRMLPILFSTTRNSHRLSLKLKTVF